MFSWKNVANYPRIIPVTPSYLELCVISEALKAIVLTGIKMSLIE